MRKLMDFEYLELASDFLLSLPPELRFGIHHLSECEKVDFTELRAKGLELIDAIKERGRFIGDFTDVEFIKAMIKSRLRGAVYSLIFSERVINEKISTILQAFKELRLRDEEIKISQSRVEYRVLDTPIQLGLMDRKLGIIILSRGVLSPFFVLEEKRKILWLESVFEYYWDIAKPLTEYIEKGKGDLKEKIFGSLQRF